MDILLLKNTGLSPLEIQDIGIYLEVGEETDLITNYRDEDIIESADVESAIAGDAIVTLDQGSGEVELTYVQLIEYLTALKRYDKIDYTYISSKDTDTDITGLELEALTNGSDTSLHIHDNRYYTKTQLSNSNTGTVAVHWGNITNTPQFGALGWKSPVDRRDTTYGAGATLPSSGNLLNDARMVRDDGDGRPAQYVCVATSGTILQQWVKIADVDWGNASSISVIPSGNLASTNIQSALEELQGDINGIVDGSLDIQHSLDDAYDDGSVITVDNTNVDFKLTDTKYFQISDSLSSPILKVNALATGDGVVINGSLETSAKTITLDATSASYFKTTAANLTLGTVTSGNVIIASAGGLTLKDQFLTAAIPLSQSGVTALDPRYTATSIIGAINEALDIAVGSNTLDDAYDGETENGAGRVITVDQGSVKLDATSSTYAPLELTSQSAAPTSGLAAGQIAVIGGVLYTYDTTRSKWLSITEQRYDWGDQNATGRYLRIGNALGTDVGFRMPGNATIVKVVVHTTGGELTKEIQIRKNSAVTPIKTFSLINGNYTSINDNVDVLAGDYLQIYVTGTGGNIQDPVVSVYLKYRV